MLTQVPIPGKMEQAHFTLSLLGNAAVKPGQNAWSSYLRTVKSKQQQEGWGRRPVLKVNLSFFHPLVFPSWTGGWKWAPAGRERAPEAL